MRAPKAMRVTAAATMVAALLLGGFTARGEEPTTIHFTYVVAPASLVPFLFPKPGIARHFGRSYTLEITRSQASPMTITALAAGEIDICTLGYSGIGVAVENAGLSDLRIIADEVRDGVGDWFTGQYAVLKDLPIRRVEDLKGKVVAANGIGSGADIIMRAVLQRHGLAAKRDYTDIEVQFANMKAMLSERKIDLATFPLPYVYQPGVAEISRPLFLQKDAFGATEMSFWVARAGFLQEHRSAVLDFLEDYVRSIRWYLDPANHKEAVEIVAKTTRLTPQSLDGWLFTKKDFYRNPDGAPDLAALQKNVDAQADQGFLKARLDVAKYADISLIEEAAKRAR